MATNKTDKNKKNIIEGEIVENTPLLSYNPLIASPVVSINDETEQKVALISDIESLSAINKQQLMVKRQQVELEVDNKKLDVAKKTISTIEKIIESVSDEDVLTRVAENIKTPQDMKYMTEAAEKLANTLKNLLNPNVADEFGGKKHHKINMLFKGQGAVQIEIPND